MKSITFHVDCRNDLSAGKRGFQEDVTIVFAYSCELEEDQIEFWRSCLKEYYDTTIVMTEEEYNEIIKRERVER